VLTAGGSLSKKGVTAMGLVEVVEMLEVER
jgi:hypothetical protein